ncbi:MAG: hypothetical protein A2804_01300 [Candidatus Pacebacteria bacterium RIFCSPHIGHO2_01_FULL_46_10]|nr:MAG: hypothetical protein A2804_01300 [Candidatus Pacebacteria bacterium RIFCSPHIGHO2_01_FULL_46_10]
MTLSDIQTKSGKFTIAACDQRASLATMLGVDPMSESGKSTLKRVKTVFMETFSPICSGVLVDPEFGMPSLEKKGRSGLLLTLEKPPYSSFDPDDIPELYDDGLYGKVGPFSGAAATKILLWYNPLSKNAEAKQQLIQKIYKKAQSAHTPFLLEILLHPLEKEFHSGEEVFKLQIKTVQTFANQCDVLKLEAPALPSEPLDIPAFEKRCAQITQEMKKHSGTKTTPWILLTRGTAYERFLLALQLAMKHGASGFAAGRAVWKEFAEFPTEEEQLKFIRTVARKRMEKLIEIVV